MQARAPKRKMKAIRGPIKRRGPTASLEREREKPALRIQPERRLPPPAAIFWKAETTANNRAAAWDWRPGASRVFCAGHPRSQIRSTTWRCPSDSFPAIRESGNRCSGSPARESTDRWRKPGRRGQLLSGLRDPRAGARRGLRDWCRHTRTRLRRLAPAPQAAPLSRYATILPPPPNPMHVRRATSPGEVTRLAPDRPPRFEGPPPDGCERRYR